MSEYEKIFSDYKLGSLTREEVLYILSSLFQSGDIDVENVPEEFQQDFLCARNYKNWFGSSC